MFRCLGRIGCAVFLLVLGAAGWHWRALWIPRARALIGAAVRTAVVPPPAPDSRVVDGRLTLRRMAA